MSNVNSKNELYLSLIWFHIFLLTLLVFINRIIKYVVFFFLITQPILYFFHPWVDFGQNHQIGSLLQINYQNESISFLFTKGVCYFTTKRLPEGRLPPEHDTWRDLIGRWDRGGSGGLRGATSSGGAQARPLVVGSGTSLFPIKPLPLRFIFTQKTLKWAELKRVEVLYTG